MERWKKEQLTVIECDGRKEMGRAAAKDFAYAVKQLLATQDTVRIVYAAAPSQNEFLEEMANDSTLDFSRIEAFHMDEYIGLPAGSPQSFGSFLKNAIFGKKPFKSVHYIDGTKADAEAEAKRYSALLTSRPIDIVCMGIGENGHIAFNDPPVADFSDPLAMKVVELDTTCRQQQVNDGCFPDFASVPTHALTLTIPTLASAAHHFCVVPATTKAQAVYDTINGPIETACPASIIRSWARPILYLDPDSARLLHE